MLAIEKPGPYCNGHETKSLYTEMSKLMIKATSIYGYIQTKTDFFLSVLLIAGNLEI